MLFSRIVPLCMSAAVLDVNFHLSLGCLHCLGVAFSMAVDPQDLDPRLGRCGCGLDARLQESALVGAGDAELGQVDQLELDQSLGQHRHLVRLDVALQDVHPKEQLSDPRTVVNDDLKKSGQGDVLDTLQADLLKALQPWQGKNISEVQGAPGDEVELEVGPQTGTFPHVSPPPRLVIRLLHTCIHLLYSPAHQEGILKIGVREKAKDFVQEFWRDFKSHFHSLFKLASSYKMIIDDRISIVCTLSSVPHSIRKIHQAPHASVPLPRADTRLPSSS